jgi:hypothetical protein
LQKDKALIHRWRLCGAAAMSAGFFRRMAQQCREMIGRARTEAARAQLRIWAVEFDSRAKAAEEEEKNRNPQGSPRC